MARYAYVNGRYVPHAAAQVHIEDRGYQFADGVYEVILIQCGQLVDEGPHLDRLDYSLKALQIPWPMVRPALRMVLCELISRNGIAAGTVYLQVTRGVAPRDHKFPTAATPSFIATTRRAKPTPAAVLATGVAVITRPDLRWRRCDIKSISLLPNVLGKQAAAAAGAFETWLVDDAGNITEGTSTNAWIVTRDGRLVTRDLSSTILSGITRLALLELARAKDISFEERAFSVSEAKTAAEAFLTSTTSLVLPVTRIDGQTVGDGKPGPVTRSLRDMYLRHVAETTSE
jgi:D-alanine transaminase